MEWVAGLGPDLVLAARVRREPVPLRGRGLGVDAEEAVHVPAGGESGSTDMRKLLLVF